jgi:hypothetical protein
LNTFKKLQDQCRNKRWLVFLILVSAGMMVFCLIGCGSESSPKVAASVKTKTSKTTGVVEDGSGEEKKVKKGMQSQRIEVVPGFTRGELEDRHAVQRKKYEEHKANMEIAPGLTKDQLEARHAEQRKKYEEYKANMEIAPGLTKDQLEARQAESRKKFAMADTEVVPGMTREQLNAKMRQQVMPEARDWLPPSARK